MPQPDLQPDWATLVADAVAAVAHGPASLVTVISSQLVGATIEIVFEGDPKFRPGRYGVRFRVPTSEDDARWTDMVAPDERQPEHWSRTAAFVEVLEPYQAVNEVDIADADADGVRRL